MKTNELILLSHGHHDYEVKGVFIVKKYFDMETIIDEWANDGNAILRVKGIKRGIKMYRNLTCKPEFSEFTDWAVHNGYIEKLKVTEFSCGDWDCDNIYFEEGSEL